jgi:transposase-like protein
LKLTKLSIGAKARNVHKNKRAEKLGMANKAMVLGVLERGGNIRARVAKDRKASAVCDIVREHVVPQTQVFTDKLLSYKELESDYAREVIDHAEGYVRGQVHTNGLENFWSLLKRGLHGTYVSVEPFHLFRYLDEQVFRFNNRATKYRKVTDADRFHMVVSKIVGKRLTFAGLTGKVAASEAF